MSRFLEEKTLLSRLEGMRAAVLCTFMPHTFVRGAQARACLALHVAGAVRALV